MPASDILHHYTNQSGVLGIIETKSFWAGKIQNLNDTKEFLHGISVARNLLKERAKSAKDNFLETHCDLLVSSLSRIEQINVFVVSFSASENLLSQWRAYSRGEIGYSLGFDKTLLERLASKQGFRLAECIYDGGKQKEIIEQVISKHIDEFKQSITDLMPKDQVFSETQREQRWAKFSSDLIMVAPLLKHSAFQEEREWRLVSIPKSSRDPAYRIRSSRNFLTPYYVFSLEESPGVCEIRRAIVGPCAYPDLALSGLTGLLGKSGIKWHSAAPSGIPFRAQ